MALKAQWNLVLRLLVDNGLWVSMVRVNFVCLFGNVGFDFSDASGNHGCRFELQLWKCLSWICSTVSQWKRPELCRKWKLFWTELETKQETLLWVCFSCFDRDLDSCVLSQAGQVWLTLLGLLQFVCEIWDGCSRGDWDRCRESVLNPETGRYSGVVVRLTELCVKILWLMYFPFWLRATVSYLSRWMDEHGDICKPIYCETSSMVFIAMIASVICLRWLWHFLW